MRGWVRVLAATMAAGLLGGCGGPADSIGELQEALVETYLGPLDDAGVTTSVIRTCRFDEAVAGAPWHLRIDIDIDGTKDRVADLLEDQDVVLRRDHDPMIVQQVFNKPGQGWDGSLSGSGDRSKLTLEHSRTTQPDRADALGWTEICPADA